MKKYLIGLLLFYSFSITYSTAQNWSIKSNLLYDLTGTLNLGTEFSLSDRITIDVSGNYNPIKFRSDLFWKHWLIQPEVRYWLCKPFKGHFIGLHTHYGEYNLSQRKYRYSGIFYGGGFSYGYQWLLSPRWSIESTVGLGYAYINYSQYDCKNCGAFITSGHKHYLGPTKLAVNLIYIIK